MVYLRFRENLTLRFIHPKFTSGPTLNWLPLLTKFTEKAIKKKISQAEKEIQERGFPLANGMIDMVILRKKPLVRRSNYPKLAR